MLKRVLVGSFAAAVVLFIWGCAAWMFLPTYTNFKDITDEDAVVRTLGESLPEKGVYYFPRHPGGRPDALADWNQRVSSGPTGIIVYNPTGHGAIGPRKFLIAFLVHWAAALCVAYVLSETLAGKPTFRRRWRIAALTGVVVSLAAYLPDWIWYGFPGRYIRNLMTDMILGWVMAGFILAYFIKTRQEEREEIKREKELKEKLGVSES